ncbi:MAG: phosphate ABC transporter substrate-binding protein PstS [Leptospirillia bacterium]
MKRTCFTLLAAAMLTAGALSFGTPAQAGSTISGAGATFPYPIYAKWAYNYNKETGVRLNYQSIGSGGGVKQIKAKTVDFGASDAPLKPEELKKNGLLQFPMIMGGVVPVVNIAGIGAGELRLTGDLVADIFLGKITRWNDPRIAQTNPGVKLPEQQITVVHRADGSGTTWIFTNYLTKVSPAWKDQVGNAKSVAWPAGLGGKGNEGVAAFVNKTKGSIGYVEYAYALQNKMANVLLKNRDGHFVAPTSESFQAAAAGADWAGSDRYYVVLTDQPGATAWPITGASFILMHTVQDKAENAEQVLNFLNWAYNNGGKDALDLDYVPMPDSVANMVRTTWTTQLSDTKGKPIWTAH